MISTKTKDFFIPAGFYDDENDEKLSVEKIQLLSQCIYCL